MFKESNSDFFTMGAPASTAGGSCGGTAPCSASGSGNITPPLASSPASDTCSAATTTELLGGGMGDVGASDVTSLDDARRIIRDLRARYRAQAQQLLAWRRAHKMQEELVTRLQREKAEQLKCLSSKLILFESRLIRKQKDISTLLNHREMIILRQQRIIDALTNRLIENGLETSNPDLTDLDTNMPDMDSLNDSDSAVIMEDIDSDSNLTQILPRFRSSNPDTVTVVRSISDAIDPNLKYSSARRSNGFLRRPEILETVYSVEEDADNENNINQVQAIQQKDNKLPSAVSKKRESFASVRSEKVQNADLVVDDGVFTEVQKPFEYNYALIVNRKSKTVDNSPEEEIENFDRDRRDSVPSWTYSVLQHNGDNNIENDDNDQQKPTRTPLNQVTTYNRVMSNHRSVTKPKDVKYKRINKAKSKSLEELRGRLRNWVEQGNKLAGISLDQAQSFA